MTFRLNSRLPDNIPVCRRRERTFQRSVLIILSLAATLFPAHDVLAQDEEEYIFCLQTNGDRDARYYTDIFRGDYRFTTGYENDFYDYLKANGWEPYRQSSNCFYGDTHEAAEARLLRHIKKDESNGYRVVRTKWSPDASPAQTADQESFADRPLQDFHILVPRSSYPVQVCVRDHECEDGDRVRVSVNGRVVLSTEIVNRWFCQEVPLRAGRHDIYLYAINGTGNKGNCSFADANTGEIRVTGENSQTQSWRHRGGKGSSARIVVTVR